MPSQMLQHAGRKLPGVAVQQLAPAQVHPGPTAAGAGLEGCRGGGGGAGGVQQWGRLVNGR
eukprot:484263-Pelagomonas_calceolata.AAC.1